jgi:hypothetical protein
MDESKSNAMFLIEYNSPVHWLDSIPATIKTVVELERPQTMTNNFSKFFKKRALQETSDKLL